MLRRTLVKTMAAGAVLQVVAHAAEGYIEVGTESSPDTTIAGLFKFNIVGTDKTFEAPLRHCTPAIPLEAGVVTVRLIAKPGVKLVRVSTLPEDRLVESDLQEAKATIVVPAGDISTQTVLVFGVEAEDRPSSGAISD